MPLQQMTMHAVAVTVNCIFHIPAANGKYAEICATKCVLFQRLTPRCDLALLEDTALPLPHNNIVAKSV